VCGSLNINKNLDRQVAAYIAICGEDNHSPNLMRVIHYMMEDINYWRDRAINPQKKRGGRPSTREMDAYRYKHLMGYVTDEYGLNQEDAAEHIAALCLGLDGVEREAKTVLNLCAGWMIFEGYNKPDSLRPTLRRFESHAETLDEIALLTGNPEYFPDAIKNLLDQPQKS
jgi:hypothetical protein